MVDYLKLYYLTFFINQKAKTKPKLKLFTCRYLAEMHKKNKFTISN